MHHWQDNLMIEEVWKLSQEWTSHQSIKTWKAKYPQLFIIINARSLLLLVHLFIFALSPINPTGQCVNISVVHYMCYLCLGATREDFEVWTVILCRFPQMQQNFSFFPGFPKYWMLVYLEVACCASQWLDICCKSSCWKHYTAATLIFLKFSEKPQYA